MNKKEIIQTIRTFKKTLKKGSSKTVWKFSCWDIHEKLYTVDEIAARFLRKKGYMYKLTYPIIQNAPLIRSATYDSIVM
ncbi:hypothetical protein [Bacteroides ovatus]|uniref:hypothetical protein n=1 Tax=Bacteroides ovatus TaxID=28116 RepID=UPI002165538C|nr:hypothetical protein [Bacteroides ovatus]MCS3035180.1 hypothetical protein [Bacteroides ovatus]